MKIFLRLGGVFHLFCAASHVFFPQMFRWSERLSGLQGQDRAVIASNLDVMNWCLLLFWVMLAYLPLVHAADLLETKIGKTLLASIVIFWCVRIFVFQPVFVGFEMEGSVMQAAILSAGLLLFAPPLFAALRPRSQG